MALKLNCLEALTAIGCGLAAITLNGAQLGALSGVTIAGVSLLTKMRENIRRHGLDEPALLEKMRLAVFRDWAGRFDESQTDRDLLVEADQAMARLLPEVMLTREELGQTVVSDPHGRYPAHAARLVADRLAAHDPIFAAVDGPADAQPLARRFAIHIVETALNTARGDRDYAALLTLDILLSVGRATAQLIDQGQLVAGGITRLEQRADAGLALQADHSQQLAEVKAMLGQLTGGTITADRIEAEFAALVSFEPGLTAPQLLQKIQDRMHERDRQVAELQAIASVHVEVENLRHQAEQALARQDDLAAADHLQAATQALRRRRDDDSRLLHKLALARARALARSFSWLAADAAWHEAIDAIAAIDPAQALETHLVAAVHLMHIGRSQGILQALDTAIDHMRAVQAAQQTGPVIEQAHDLLTNLGIALDLRARQSSPDIAAGFLREAIAAHESALPQAPDNATRGTILTNLSAALCLKAQLCPENDARALLIRAIDTARAATDQFDRGADPGRWATANVVCAAAYVAAGLWLPHGEKLDMLRLGAMTYMESLPILAEGTGFELGLAMEDLAICYEAMAKSAEDDRSTEYLQLARKGAATAIQLFNGLKASAKEQSARQIHDRIDRRLGTRS